MKHSILQNIHAECPWRDTLHWFETIDSTNTYAKSLAAQGAPEGTVIIAGHQSGGRGRMGRTFDSQKGMGVYLSLILRPDCAPGDLMHLTCAAAVAMVRAIEDAAMFTPMIKWTNDLVYEKRKLGGILTELGLDPITGRVSYAVIGIGINCLQKPKDFPEELQSFAGSLSMAAGNTVLPEKLAGAMVTRLFEMNRQLFRKQELMEAYKKHCMTLGQNIRLCRGDEVFYGKALGLTEEGELIVEFADGNVKAVGSGEVSVRGMYGYS